MACADSKRRCDKQLPECQRCLDRDVDCVYPQPKRRRKDHIARDGQAEELASLQNYAGAGAGAGADADAPGTGLDHGGWSAMERADLDVPLPDVILPYIPITPASVVANGSTQVALESIDNSSASCPWFLRDETWVMQRNNREVICVTSAELESFIPAVGEMLQCWVSNGYNSFIHRRLYEKGMPTCIQDAFTTLAAYTARTPAVRETILQIADDRSSALTSQSPPTASGAQGILEHLARVQALLVYVFIRLFDGSVRLRASAEQQLPTLRQWTNQMSETVKQYRREEDGFLGHSPLQWAASEFDREYETSLEMWRLWILTESVRRTHVVIDTFANIYQIMTEGWVDCAGAFMITTRRGLWEAESSARWSELSCAKPPLLVPFLQPEPLISQYAAEEFDEFATMYWKFIVGPDKMQYWFDRSSRAIDNTLV